MLTVIMLIWIVWSHDSWLQRKSYSKQKHTPFLCAFHFGDLLCAGRTAAGGRGFSGWGDEESDPGLVQEGKGVQGSLRCCSWVPCYLLQCLQHKAYPLPIGLYSPCCKWLVSVGTPKRGMDPSKQRISGNVDWHHSSGEGRWVLLGDKFQTGLHSQWSRVEIC